MGSSEPALQTRLRSHDCPSHPSPQSLRSSCCTRGRWRSGVWTLTTPTTTTSSPSRCLTSTTSRWWTTTLWSSAFTGLMSAPRPSREPLSTALAWRPLSLRVGVEEHYPAWLLPSGPRAGQSHQPSRGFGSMRLALLLHLSVIPAPFSQLTSLPSLFPFRPAQCSWPLGGLGFQKPLLDQL